MKTRKHECEAAKDGFMREFGWSLENRGDGWYMYDKNGQQRSPSEYNFCPSCGERLEKGDVHV